MGRINVILTVVVITSAVVSIAAQTPTAELAFEVASIKPDPWGNGGFTNAICKNGRCVLRHQSVVRLVAFAYDMNADGPYIVENAPWMRDQTYVVEAVSEKREATDAEYQVMVQNLLKDRFNIKLHRESRLVSGYSLLIVNEGTKLKSSAVGEDHVLPSLAPPPGYRSGPPRPPIKGPHVSFMSDHSGDKLVGYEQSLPMMARVLAQLLQSAVVDKTNLSGLFDFSLSWIPDERQRGGVRGLDNDQGPSLFAALQDQLGLRLKAEKVSAEVIVIDSAQKPTQN